MLRRKIESPSRQMGEVSESLERILQEPLRHTGDCKERGRHRRSTVERSAMRRVGPAVPATQPASERNAHRCTTVERKCSKRRSVFARRASKRTRRQGRPPAEPVGKRKEGEGRPPARRRKWVRTRVTDETRRASELPHPPRPQPPAGKERESRHSRPRRGRHEAQRGREGPPYRTSGRASTA